MDYANYMSRCLCLARLGEYYVAPNPMVGAVLVDNRTGDVLGEGWHRRFGSAHAEVNCFADAESRHSSVPYADATLFVSLEPCSHYGKTPPCANLIIEKGIGRVVVGMQDPNEKVAGRGIAMLRAAGITVEVGVLEAECRALNKRFLCLHEQHRPYVVLKWAQTADGYIDRLRTGLGDGAPLVISTPLTKQLVHKMRAENMAILVGTNTVLKDNPRLLTTRWSGRNPLRVVLDRHGRIPSDARVFGPEAETLVYRENTGWAFVLADLASRGVHSVLVEGGATLLQTILSSGVYDEIHIEVSPVRIGEGVPAPSVPLPDRVERIDGHLLYSITHTPAVQ